jgi:hypothetical protein
LRWVYSPIKDDTGWRIGYNTEIYDLYEDVKVTAFITFTRLEWAGPLIRMEKHHMPKKALQEKNPQQKKGSKTEETMGRWNERECHCIAWHKGLEN